MSSPRRYRSPCVSYEDEKECDAQQNCMWFNDLCRDKRYNPFQELDKDVW